MIERKYAEIECNLCNQREDVYFDNWSELYSFKCTSPFHYKVNEAQDYTIRAINVVKYKPKE